MPAPLFIMKFLNHIRSKSKLKNETSEASLYGFRSPTSTTRYGGRSLASKLPSNVLESIFAHVCPHVRDDTYLKLEDSMQDGDCMLCDLRDLAHCVLVNRQWGETAQKLL